MYSVEDITEQMSVFHITFEGEEKQAGEEAAIIREVAKLIHPIMLEEWRRVNAAKNDGTRAIYADRFKKKQWGGWLLMVGGGTAEGFHSAMLAIARNAGVRPESVMRVCLLLSSLTHDAALKRALFDGWALSELRGRVTKEEEAVRERQRRGGETRSTKQQWAYDTHKDWWNKWQQDPSLYVNLTAYDEAMRDKTGASNKGIRIHRAEFSGAGNK